MSTFLEIKISSIEPTPVFIVGMPRSGTTLVEQIISSHHKVYGAGELPFLSSVVHNNFFNENKLDKQKKSIEVVATEPVSLKSRPSFFSH